MRSHRRKALAESWRKKCTCFCSGIDLSAVLPKFAVIPSEAKRSRGIPRTKPRESITRSLDFARNERPNWDYSNDSRSNLPVREQALDWGLAFCPVADRARADAHADACAESERFAGRRDNCPHF